MLCCAALCGLFPRSTIAADDEVRQAIGQLADKDDAVRQKALDSLLQTRDGRLSAALKSYQEGNLYLWKGRPAVGEQAAPDAAGKRTALLDPLTLEPLVEDAKPVVLPNGDLKEVELPRSDRKAVNAAVHALALWSNDFEKRVSAIQSAGENRAVELLPALEEIVTADPSAKIRHTARESIDVVQVDGVFPMASRSIDWQRPAIWGPCTASGAAICWRTCSHKPIKTRPPAGRRTRRPATFIDNRLRKSTDTRTGLPPSIASKTGCRAGRSWFLMAAGPGHYFRPDGRDQHGPRRIDDGRRVYDVQHAGVVRAFLPPLSAFNWYFVAALPASFLVAALCGYLIEMLVVRHLYGRPLETLLATFGISLILSQSVLAIYGYNIGVNSPTWLQGRVEVLQDMVVPYNRGFIVVLCASACCCFTSS